MKKQEHQLMMRSQEEFFFFGGVRWLKRKISCEISFFHGRNEIMDVWLHQFRNKTNAERVMTLFHDRLPDLSRQDHAWA